MKNKKIGVVVLAMLVFALVACDTGNNPKTDPPKVIEEKYRFSNGDWDGMYDNEGSGKITVDQTSITTTTDINLSGIYSSGGGSIDGGGTWAYLYDDSGKIGIIYDTTYFIYVKLGKTYISESIANDDFSDFSPIPDSSDMKDAYNGNGYYHYSE